jgi:hypothetical protein
MNAVYVVSSCDTTSNYAISLPPSAHTRIHTYFRQQTAMWQREVKMEYMWNLLSWHAQRSVGVPSNLIHIYPPVSLQRNHPAVLYFFPAIFFLFTRNWAWQVTPTQVCSLVPRPQSQSFFCYRYMYVYQSLVPCSDTPPPKRCHCVYRSAKFSVRFPH